MRGASAGQKMHYVGCPPALPTVLDSAVAQGHEIDAASLSLSQIRVGVSGSIGTPARALGRTTWIARSDSRPSARCTATDRLRDTGLAGTIAFPCLDGRSPGGGW